MTDSPLSAYRGLGLPAETYHTDPRDPVEIAADAAAGFTLVEAEPVFVEPESDPVEDVVVVTEEPVVEEDAPVAPASTVEEEPAPAAVVEDAPVAEPVLAEDAPAAPVAVEDAPVVEAPHKKTTHKKSTAS